MRIAIIKKSYFQRIINKLLYYICHRHISMVCFKVLLIVDFPEKDSFHTYIRFYYKRIGEGGAVHIFQHRVKRLVGFNVNRFWKIFVRQKIIHFFFAFSFKTSKSECRIGCTEKPYGTAFKNVPAPDKKQRKVEREKWPVLPVT